MCRMVHLDRAYWNRRKRHDFRLGLAICIPIYGYVICKLVGV